MGIIEFLLPMEGADRETAYGDLSHAILKRLARGRGVKIHAALSKEQLASRLIAEELPSVGGSLDGGSDSATGYFSTMGVKELRREAAERRIPGRSKMNKADLVRTLKGE